MKCDSCNVDIPPAWVKVIASNICVECQGPIMSEQTVELMTGLKEALEQMPNDPQGIAGWLLSNYRMQKVGTGEPTGFYGIKNKQQNNNEHNNLKIAENPMQKFYKAAGIDPEQVKNKALVAQINGLNSIDKDNDFSDLEVQDNEYISEAEDPEYTKQALRAMEEPSLPIKQKRYVEPDFDSGLEDLPHPLLKGDRMKRLEAQKDLVLGGSVGKIRRS